MYNRSAQERMVDDELAWNLYTQGWTQSEIAEHFQADPNRPNHDSSNVGKAIKAWRDQLPDEDRAQIRTAVLAGTMRVLRNAAELMEAQPIPAYSNGRPILDKEGNICEDHSGRLAAMAMVLKVHERISRMVGLDAPTQIDLHVSVAAQEQAELAAKEALARVFTIVSDDGTLAQIESS